MAFHCLHCPLRFKRNYHLSRHQTLHSAERNYACASCSKTFSRQCTLSRHLLTHSEVKKYTCYLCKKQFKRKYSLILHTRMHTGLKPFKCSQCTSTFYQKSGLSRHERTHTGVHPFVCSFCSKGFSQSSSLIRHQKVHLRLKSKQQNFRELNEFDEEKKPKMNLKTADMKIEVDTIQVKAKDGLEYIFRSLKKIEVNGPQWPNGNSVSWDTLPPLYVTLCRTGLIPEKFITSGSHWDPFYLNGNVAKVLSSLGFDIRHEKEDFWDVWPTVLTKDTYIITNPPFGSGMLYWLRAFFTFIVTFDNPFVLILPNYICSRQYFKKAFSKIARPNELHIFSIDNSFPLIRKDRESPTGFVALTIIAYYPAEWGFEIDQKYFANIFTKKYIYVL